ncbi:acyltransferase [Pseudokordiimonas caeni]|uniref:acyltransferase n=1 Tax=Pseudokordiimonas caeni TaxID=2997908 RepID=UPI002810F668|nr:acyltransferase [Pseudokordiimonas caeni]
MDILGQNLALLAEIGFPGGLKGYSDVLGNEPLERIPFADLPDGCVTGSFDDSNFVYTFGSLKNQQKFKIGRHGPASPAVNCHLVLLSDAGSMKMLVAGGHARLFIGARTKASLDLRMWRYPTVVIGDDTTINAARIVADKSAVLIGKDCLFSDSILIQSNDQHGIIDMKTGELRNKHRRRTVIGDHVWVGRRSIVMPDVTIGHGAIVATAAVVTADVPPFGVAGGVPARLIGEDTSWTREPSRRNDREQAFFNAHYPTKE